MSSVKQQKNLVRWIEALLSGEYKQGQRKLYDPLQDCYCATGVAAEVMGVPRLFGGYIVFGRRFDSLSWADVVGLNLWRKAWLPEQWFIKTFGNVPQAIVVAMNDRKFDPVSFAEIACYLVSFLPNGNADKTRLQDLINKQLRIEGKVREDWCSAMVGVNE